MNQKRYAVASALAATAVPALVMARGHRVEEVPEFPLVVDTSLESCTKTSAALATLKALGAESEMEKVWFHAGKFDAFMCRILAEVDRHRVFVKYI